MAKEEKKDEKNLSAEEGLKLVQQRRKTTHQTKAGGKVVEWMEQFLQWTIRAKSAGRICGFPLIRIIDPYITVRLVVMLSMTFPVGMKG